ncbi:hypothetical protein [Ancylobacter mangrovi]|uniref:hypothetical protein n=1 Tax=Ancylobacter mangrovi TaxID=2972472 RepID=UPI0021620512|nr:hypothetical protein [Ancylobacter mangrovi]MCS0501056.1 hypothetical protein [Ancylobacter mangrovi]
MPHCRERRRIRAQRVHEPESAIAARSEALRPFLGGSREERSARLRSLLRAERRAARRGQAYDPLRHAALARLMAEIGGTGAGK